MIIHYYRATAADAATVAECRIHFLTELFGKPTPEHESALRTELITYLQQALDSGQVICWLAKADNIVVGIGTLALRVQPGSFVNPGGRWGYIQNMYTYPGYRRRGISTEILKKLIETASAEGITAFELHATEDGEPVYVRYGFLKHAEPTYRLQH